MTSYKCNRLSFDEMWELYKLIKDGLPKKEEEYLVYEVIKILEGIDVSSFKQSLRVMYGDDFSKEQNPAEYALMFIKGIKETGILSFALIIEGIHGYS